MSRYLLFLLLLSGCKTIAPLVINSGVTGSSFYKFAASFQWKQRDSVALELLEDGNIPAFLNHFVPVHTSIKDQSGKTISATYYVMPDYLSIGTNADWARIPLTPQTAQRIANKYHCFLPTRKMVNDIYHQATVKLEPMPMFAFRDSTVTMWQHHLMIEGQRKGRKGLIAGIKKDVVISSRIKAGGKGDRVAIYGWHKLSAEPIQPLYTGHINWYVDYSHGIRLIYETIRVNGKAMHYKEVLKDPFLRKLLCDEEICDCFGYEIPTDTALQ
ncbi:hypothetical protein BC659_0397 [Sediminibacterium goheungense]|uniref:Uncharacterized protein n=1 Tax=Sediminibacterium goheungense TaxID=1086393 RepID=A0A4R6IZK1_9BACT|nr:hypothetical protein BC659_0397 [Sediminibacterium goheungense]